MVCPADTYCPSVICKGAFCSIAGSAGVLAEEEDPIAAIEPPELALLSITVEPCVAMGLPEEEEEAFGNSATYPE